MSDDIERLCVELRFAVEDLRADFPGVANTISEAADALAALVRERDALQEETDNQDIAIKLLMANLAAARAQVATLRDGLSKIARYRAECLAYDADTGREPRSFDKEDVKLIEGMARSLLSHVGATEPQPRDCDCDAPSECDTPGCGVFPATEPQP